MAAPTIKFARGDVISRKYEIETHLGDGLYGASYRARHITSGRALVIKFLHPELFPSEAESAAFKDAFDEAKTLRHPGLVRYGEINQHHGTPYYTQEYFKSQSLRQLIDEYRNQGQNFSIHEVCQLIVKINEALHATHEQGLAHGNLKPENVLVHTTRTGPGQDKVVRHIKLTGVGLSPTLQNIKSLVEFDSRPEFVYQAPELAAFNKDSQPSIDIYSLGVIFYELLVGQVPGQPFSYPKELRDELPEHTNQIIDVALSAKAEDRYPTAPDMSRDVQRCLDTEMLMVAAPTPLRNILLGIGGLVALAFLLIAHFSTREEVDVELTQEQATRKLRNSVKAANQGKQELAPTEIANMSFIPAGVYLTGQLPIEKGKVPHYSEAQEKTLPSYYIDKYEYPNQRDAIPKTGVTNAEAEALCAQQNKRLCTGDEWEKACKGNDNLIYSYADHFEPDYCQVGKQGYTSHQKSNCRSQTPPYIYDLSGGFSEWTAGSVVKGGVPGIAYYSSTDYRLPSSVPGKDGTSISLDGKSVVFVGWHEAAKTSDKTEEAAPEDEAAPSKMGADKWVDTATNTFQVRVSGEVVDVVVPEKYYGQVSKFALKEGAKIPAKSVLFTTREVNDGNGRAVERGYRCAYKEKDRGPTYYSNFITFRCCVSSGDSAKVGTTSP